ncbi:hypothetical protein H9P43_006667 [Blastocladiella emersonii ATCC 22665]|nr:hypothetical protein H9P43_006667 [Blastocladiella emersonii ATCC 22665]
MFGSRRDPAEDRARARREQEKEDLRRFLEAQARAPRTTRRSRVDDEGVGVARPGSSPAVRRDVNAAGAAVGIRSAPSTTSIGGNGPTFGRRAEAGGGGRSQWDQPPPQPGARSSSSVRFQDAEDDGGGGGGELDPRYRLPPIQQQPAYGGGGGWPGPTTDPRMAGYYHPGYAMPPPPPPMPYGYGYPQQGPPGAIYGYPAPPVGYPAPQHAYYAPPPQQYQQPPQQQQYAPPPPAQQQYAPPPQPYNPPPAREPLHTARRMLHSPSQTSPPTSVSVTAIGASDPHARDRDRARQLAYQRDLEAQVQDKKRRDEAERAARHAADAKGMAEADGYNPYGRAGAGAPVRNADGSVVGTRGAVAAAAQQGGVGAGVGGGEDPATIARAMALANEALVRAGLAGLVLAPPAAAPVAANPLSALGFGPPPSTSTPAPAALTSPKTSHLRGHIDPSTVPAWQREEAAKKQAATLTLQADLRAQMEAKERAKAEEAAREREADAREAARLAAEMQELEARHAREREEEAKRKKEAEEKAKIEAEEKRRRLAAEGGAAPPAGPPRAASPPLPAVAKRLAANGGTVPPDAAPTTATTTTVSPPPAGSASLPLPAVARRQEQEQLAAGLTAPAAQAALDVLLRETQRAVQQEQARLESEMQGGRRSVMGGGALPGAASHFVPGGGGGPPQRPTSSHYQVSPAVTARATWLRNPAQDQQLQPPRHRFPDGLTPQLSSTRMLGGQKPESRGSSLNLDAIEYRTQVRATQLGIDGDDDAAVLADYMKS